MCKTQSSQSFYEMTNVIQEFAWGSKTSFNQLFDIDNPNNLPQAEIWMGSHPNGCSNVLMDGVQVRLSELIDSDKDRFLSTVINRDFGELPYLFKVLAADSALSVQVHPNKTEAEEGFHREELAQIPISAAYRNYRDTNHKPELVYALTSYQAMNGFRSISEIITLFSEIDQPQLKTMLNRLIVNPLPEGLRDFFVELLSLKSEEKNSAVEQLLLTAREKSHEELFSLIITLSEQYPGDIGLFTPLILNVLTLEPGEAMYLDARTPHAYLSGTGLEIMANSDNVLRAGLTPKHIDVTELALCTLFEEKPVETLKLTPIQNGECITFPVPVPDFKFSVYSAPLNELNSPIGAEILLPLDDELVLSHRSGETLTVKKGRSVFIPAYVDEYSFSSKGRVAKAHS